MLRGLSWFAGGRTGRGRRRRRPPGRDRDPHPRRWGVRELYAERCGGTWRTGTRCWPAGTPGCVALLVPVAAARPGAGARIGGRPRRRARSRNPAAAAPSIVDHAGRAIARDTGLDDRELVINRLGDAHRLRLTLATVRQTVTGPRRPLAHSPFLTARHVWLHTDPPMDLDVDGEIRGRTPAQITLEANALRVMVGADFPDVRGSFPTSRGCPFAAAVHSPTPRHRRHRQ